jgi:hypothetical protein
MDPITKALHETWKNIVTESSYSPPRAIIGGVKDPFDYVEPDGKGGYRPKKRIKSDLDVGLEIGPNGEFRVAPKKPKPTPTPGKTPYDDRAGDAPEPAKTPYDDRGGSEDKVPTPTPKPTPGYEPSPFAKAAAEAFKKHKGTLLPEREYYYGDGDGKYLRAAKEAAVDQIKPDFIGAAGPGGYKRQPIIPTRTPAPQPAVPATTGSGLLNSILNTNKKMYNSVTGSLPSMPKIYEERDAEGQMAIGELKVLAQKAQELARMMKDDTQLEAWVQSKITKAKDYISSVHDYMNGNPDKID